MPKQISKSPHKKTDKKNKLAPNWFYFILILLPILFFVLLEVFLRLINYGNDYTLFVPLSKRFPGKLYINPNICKKYFSNIEYPPTPIPDAIDAVKKPNSFRIFVLGGSSAEGYPYIPNASFPRDLKRRLELLYPNKNIEIMNCGMSAINSYTLRDFTPDIIKQKPDLILSYAGHNEYYGAMGVGSSNSFAAYRGLNNLYIWLQDFKTTQLIINILHDIAGIFKSKKNGYDKSTLMEKMIGKSLIPLYSNTYQEGLKQFKGNMTNILKMFKDENIPVIIGTLACNIKDLKPFISQKEKGLPSADSIYNAAQYLLVKRDTLKARELFIEAKNLDELRFRAPSEMNKIIFQLGKKYNDAVIDIDSILNADSPDGILGYNLTVDHLHPNLTGYKIIARSFYLEMKKNNLLPHNSENIPIDNQDSLLNLKYPITQLDSVIGKIEIQRLIKNYPFIPKGAKGYLIENYKPRNIIDSTAKEALLKQVTWEKAHSKIAEWYWEKHKVENFIREINAIIVERPYDPEPYEYLTKKLIANNLFDNAMPYLEKLSKIKPSSFTLKWLGQISLSKKKFDDAISYLTESIKFKDDDPQVWYNLAGAYFNLKQNNNTLAVLKRCLQISPDYKPAQIFYNKLMNASK